MCIRPVIESRFGQCFEFAVISRISIAISKSSKSVNGADILPTIPVSQLLQKLETVVNELPEDLRYRSRNFYEVIIEQEKQGWNSQI